MKDREREVAYRRGYVQGFFSATQTPKNRLKIVLRKIMKWRWRHDGGYDLPPEQY
jgi:hypothetical protein